MPDGRGRIVVGLERSLAGLAALRWAADIAGRTGAPLYVVCAHRIPLGGNGFRPMLAARTPDAHWHDTGRHEVRAAFLDSMGDVPDGLDVHVAPVTGGLIPNLVELADRDDDLIVVGGASPERRRRGPAGSRMSRHHLDRARCPVLVVPAPWMARTIGFGVWSRPA